MHFTKMSNISIVLARPRNEEQDKHTTDITQLVLVIKTSRYKEQRLRSRY